MRSGRPQTPALSRSRRYVALVVLIFWLSISSAIGCGVGILLTDLLPGGPGLGGFRRSTASSTAEAIGGFLGLVSGLLFGFWLWKKFMLSTGLLSNVQMEELYKDEAVALKGKGPTGKDYD